MKKRLFALICVLALCMCGLGIAGCGNSGGDAAAGGDDAEQASEPEAQAEPEPAADPSEKFVGEWKLAVIESQGVSITGSYQIFLEEAGIEGQDGTVLMTINDDKTGTLAMGEGDGSFTWVLKDDDTLAATVVSKDEDNDDLDFTKFDIAYEDEVVSFELTEDSDPIKFIFSKDGTLEGYIVVDANALTDVSSEDELIGTWKVSGVCMGGMTAYGNADMVATMIGSDDMTLTIEEGGSCTLADATLNWGIDDEGAYIYQAEERITLKKSGDLLVMDMTPYMGDTDMLVLFSK